MRNLEKYSKPILRVSISLVFLYFGYQQIVSPGAWSGYVPDFVLAFGLSAGNLVIFNALLEIALGLLLLIGLFTRPASLILAVNLFLIMFSLGFNEIGVRDFGLAFATLAIFLNGADDYCLDKKFGKKIRGKI